MPVGPRPAHLPGSPRISPLPKWQRPQGPTRAAADLAAGPGEQPVSSPHGACSEEPPASDTASSSGRRWLCLADRGAASSARDRCHRPGGPWPRGRLELLEASLLVASWSRGCLDPCGWLGHETRLLLNPADELARSEPGDSRDANGAGLDPPGAPNSRH